jgi:hypothetical protein
VVHHPTQRHMVLAGGEDGSLTVWDLRHNTFPVTLLSAHSDTGTTATSSISVCCGNYERESFHCCRDHKHLSLG